MDLSGLEQLFDNITAAGWSLVPKIVLVALVFGVIALIWNELSIGITLKQVIKGVVFGIAAVAIVTALLTFLPS